MVRDVFDAQGIAGLKGWMGVGHGMLQLRTRFVSAHLTLSPLPHCWLVGARRGSAVLCQLALWYHLCPREL